MAALRMIYDDTLCIKILLFEILRICIFKLHLRSLSCQIDTDF